MVHLLLRCSSSDLKTSLIAVDADDRCDIEIELVELLDKFLDPRARSHLAVSRADVIGFDKQFLLGQINHDQVFCVGSRERINLDLALAVGENSVAAAERFNGHSPFAALQTVGVARMRRARNFFIEYPGIERDDYRRVLSHKRAYPAGVIEMVVSRNRVADRLSREPLFDRLDHRRGASLVQRPFDRYQMVAHLD